MHVDFKQSTPVLTLFCLQCPASGVQVLLLLDFQEPIGSNLHQTACTERVSKCTAEQVHCQ